MEDQTEEEREKELDVDWNEIKKLPWSKYLIVIGFVLMLGAAWMVIPELKCSKVLCNKIDGDWNIKIVNNSFVYTCNGDVISWWIRNHQKFCEYDKFIHLFVNVSEFKK